MSEGEDEAEDSWNKLQTPKLPEGYLAVDKALLIKLYNAGYKTGHHDTVEGQYTDIFEVDMDSYHEDDVDEIIEGAL
jgi:hypothetical protein